jgi:hypothetical protein
MPDLLGIILVGYAAAAWANGYRAKDRDELGEDLCVRDADLDTICGLLREWEEDEDESDA